MARERKAKDMTMRKLATICPTEPAICSPEPAGIAVTDLTLGKTEAKEAPAKETGAPDILLVSLEEKEKNLNEEITSAIKEELAAESIYASAKQRAKDARKAYQEFLAQYRSEISLPLLQEMIKRG